MFDAEVVELLEERLAESAAAEDVIAGKLEFLVEYAVVLAVRLGRARFLRELNALLNSAVAEAKLMIAHSVTKT